MADHPVTRHKEDFFTHLQSAFSWTDMCHRKKKKPNPQTSFGNKVT